MRYFKIIYKRGKKRFSTILEAENRVAAIENFFDKKLGVMVKIYEVEKPISLYIKEIEQKFNNPIKNRSVNLEKLISIIDQLVIMLDAGLPLNAVLNEVVKNQEDKMLKAIFENIKSDIEAGKSFYNAAKVYKRQLGYITLSMIRLGEETGTLAESLKKLADILQAILDNRRKFKKATRYPIFVIFAMAIAFTIVITMVVPQFEKFFKESHMDLPFPTRLLLWLEHAINAYGSYIVSGAVSLFLITLFLYKRNEKVRFFLDYILLKVYIVGKATLFAMISRFLYIFRILVDAGIPINEAVKTASDIIDNSYIKKNLYQIPLAIEEGKSLYEGFENTKLFENMSIEMIKAGETGGAIGKMIEKVSKIYQDRFEYIVDNIATLIEPILIGAIAGFVLVLALGIFLPMWNMVNTAG